MGIEINDKETHIPTISHDTVGSVDVQLDPVVVRKLRWKMDVVLLPLLVVMYTFK
jgi:hypothetical protein